MILSDKIITLRKKSGWSQEELASELGVSRQSVSKWESAMSVPDMDKILKLSAIFGVSTDYLLKDELEEATPSETKGCSDADCRSVDAEEANEYMFLVEKLCRPIALSVSLLILSPIPLLLLGAYADAYKSFSEDLAGGIGAALLLILIIPAVISLILNGMKLSGYEYLEKEDITLAYGVEGIVSKRKNEFEQRFRSYIVIGVALCIAGIIPLLLAGGLGLDDFILVCAVCLLLVFISVGAFFFVRAGMIHESFEKLLQTDDYTKKEKEFKRKAEFFPGTYWCIVTAIYLAISFYFNNWDRSWIVWPVAGVLYAAVVAILKKIYTR